MFGFKTSVDAIVASIVKKVEQLEAAVVHHNTVATGHLDAAATSNQLASAAATEADRASRIATKLKDLLA